MSLDATAKRRYARQLLLGEIGEAGQVRLSKAGFCRGDDVDAGAYVVASEYLRRAGCPERDGDAKSIDDSTPDAVRTFAGTPSLYDPAAAVLGAFAAVEHLKQALGIGRPSNFPPQLTLQPKRGQSPFPKG